MVSDYFLNQLLILAFILQKLTYPEPVFSTGVGEVYDQLKWFIVEWFQRQQYMINKKLSIDLPNPAKKHHLSCQFKYIQLI